jgi:glycosyltransferase involved in cell wall biosynthesis
MKDLSVVIPVKDERDNVRPLCERVHTALDRDGLDYEIIIVDDGSSDGTFVVLEGIAAVDPRLRVIRLRRNFGQSAALKAGIDWSVGEIVVTMDGDLQNDPGDIPGLLEVLAEGYDAVLGMRANRQDKMLMRKVPSWAGNWLIRTVTGVQIHDMGCTLRAMRRDLAEALPLYGEMHRFIPVLAQQYGARLKQVPVRHHARSAGTTKYTLSRTFRVLLDLMTVMFLHSYLTRPMHVLGLGGLVSMALGAGSLAVTVWMKSRYGMFLTGNPLLLLSVMLELVGVQFISLGLISEIMTRTYFESQGKSSYVVKSTLNVDQPWRHKAA